LVKFVIVFFLLLTNTLVAEIAKVNIAGNARVNKATIESLVDKKKSNND